MKKDNLFSSSFDLHISESFLSRSHFYFSHFYLGYIFISDSFLSRTHFYLRLIFISDSFLSQTHFLSHTWLKRNVNYPCSIPQLTAYVRFVACTGSSIYQGTMRLSSSIYEVYQINRWEWSVVIKWVIESEKHKRKLQVQKKINYLKKDFLIYWKVVSFLGPVL